MFSSTNHHPTVASYTGVPTDEGPLNVRSTLDQTKKTHQKPDGQTEEEMDAKDQLLRITHDLKSEANHAAMIFINLSSRILQYALKAHAHINMKNVQSDGKKP